MSSTLKGAMIGCGWFAENHRQAWRRIPEVEIVAAADLRLDRAQKFASRAYASAEEMLDREQLDFVDIATHATSHLHMVRLACQKKFRSSARNRLRRTGRGRWRSSMLPKRQACG